MNRECVLSFGDASYMAQQPKHSINQQYSSSTDEGCETDHGGENIAELRTFLNQR